MHWQNDKPEDLIFLEKWLQGCYYGILVEG